jgi:integrase
MPNGDTRYSVNVSVDGQRIHRVIGRDSDGTTRTQAEEFIAKARSDARDGRLQLPSGRKLNLTFGAASEIYLAGLREIDGKDYTANEQHLRLHLVPYFWRMRLDQISTFTLLKFQNASRAKGLSQATVNRILATYRRMGRRLYNWKKIPLLPAMIELEREHNARTFVISDAEEERLLAAALADSNAYIWLFIKLGIATGLRHSEMLTARFDGFDPERRRLRVRAKGGRQRHQPLMRSITEILVRERGMAADSEGWIFPSKTSASGHVRALSGAFARCARRAGLNPTVVVPHAMRHTAITRLAQSGADLKTIQEFSGHETLQMVMRYAHAQDQVVDRALDRMDGRTAVEHLATQKQEKS